MNVKFRVGRVNACVSEEDAVRLVACLLEQDSLAASRAATRIMVALQEQVLEQAA